MSQPGIDLTSELLRGMRLSGVNYRRIETARPFGVGFSAVAGKAQFHFISRGPVLLRMASENSSPSRAAMHCLFPTATGTPCFLIRRPRWSMWPSCPAKRCAAR